jgi:capsular polysaccharide biosynthesis protein
VLELQRNLFVLRRWWWLLVLGAFVGGVVAYGITKAIVKTRYDAVATVSTGAAPQGQAGTYFATTDGAVDGTLLLSPGVIATVQRLVPSISRSQLMKELSGTASQQACVSLDSSKNGNQCQLLSLHVQWTDSNLSIRLANAVATAFMEQERVRLEQGYALYHREITAQERTLATLVHATPGSGAAQNWLQAQYANTLSGLYGNDSQARVQALIAERSLQMAEPAGTTTTTKVSGPKATVNGALGAILGLFLALMVAFFATSSYGNETQGAGPRSVLSRVSD